MVQKWCGIKEGGGGIYLADVGVDLSCKTANRESSGIMKWRCAMLMVRVDGWMLKGEKMRYKEKEW